MTFDLRPDILECARARFSLDQRLKAQWASFAAGDGLRMPFADAVFDGVICMNAFHHMPDYAAALKEIRRVLKPGGRAVFSEPGSEHANAPESLMVAQQFGEVEKSIYLNELAELAQAAGFSQMLLKPLVYPEMAELPMEQLEMYRQLGERDPNRKQSATELIRALLNLVRDRLNPVRGRRPPPPPKTELPTFAYPRAIADCLVQSHSIFVLVVPGERPPTSARPRSLRADWVTLEPLPAVACAGQELRARFRVRNSGDTLWLSQPRELGGHVTLGIKLILSTGRLVSDGLQRTFLERDVPVGSDVELAAHFQLPADLPPGHYVVRFDLVTEQIAWFEQRGSPVVECPLEVLPGEHGDNHQRE